jgi:hypothetical protein
MLRGLVDELQRADVRGTLTDNARAELEGLTEDPRARARLRPLEGESPTHHGIYLVGKLIAFHDMLGTELDVNFVVPGATTYCVGLAERAATHDEGDLRDPRVPAHTYAMVRVEKKLAHPLPVEQENLLVTWLVHQLGLRPMEDAGRQLGEQRRRRHSKLFPDLESSS